SHVRIYQDEVERDHLVVRQRSGSMQHTCFLMLAVMVVAGCNARRQPPAEQSAAPEAEPLAVLNQEPAQSPDKKERVVVTARAAAQIRKLIAENQAQYLRLSVTDDHEYKLDLDPQMDPEKDLLGESGGVVIVVDRQSAMLVPLGIVVDFIDE